MDPDPPTVSPAPNHAPRPPRQPWLDLARYGLREPLLRFGHHLAVLAVISLGVWATRVGLDRLPESQAAAAQENSEATPTVVSEIDVSDLPPFAGGPLPSQGLVRLVNAHTVIPTRPRLEIIKYVVQPGDSVFGIASQFGLKPQSILWVNYDVLQDNPHALRAGQELSIPPVDGTTYTWHAGDSLAAVASFFGVAPEDILTWPGNNLDPAVDLQDPGIEPGTTLVVPGGHREFVSWSAFIPRANPALARIYGPGACGSIVDGPIGTGTFIWPTPLHYLSGYDYNPAANHPAIDIAGDEGHEIRAADSGVVVYAGWNNSGYGLVIVVDHGNGWQTLYAHLSQINVACGEALWQGTLIGLMGSTGNSTGPHLHFEMINAQYGKVNPWNFLP
ncbi:MAG: peptidoglycan DD-metalloendopeptidase family protein [Chloroflexota bacterium]